jgi:murein hydrolase activator
MKVIIVQHGKYFTTYSNLSSASVNIGQDIKTGQAIGRVAANLDGIGAVDFFLSNEKGELNPEQWLHKK